MFHLRFTKLDREYAMESGGHHRIQKFQYQILETQQNMVFVWKPGVWILMVGAVYIWTK